ncbi:MAG: MarR family transcriptional regulator [Acidobacteriaceae bacterium]|nr:MarR family transcriptional regulator [Acidobacteriaceae bacterium]
MSRKERPIRRNDTEQGPYVGALLRLAWQRIRERIYLGVRNEGYSELGAAHIGLFRYEGFDGLRLTELAGRMQITKQSVHDLLRHLERHGYAERRPNPMDKRSRLIYLTARGRRLEVAARKYARLAERELENELGQKRFQQFRATLRKINRLSS